MSERAVADFTSLELAVAAAVVVVTGVAD